MNDKDKLIRHLETENKRLTSRVEELENKLLHVIGQPWVPSPAETAESLAEETTDPPEDEDFPGYTDARELTGV